MGRTLGRVLLISAAIALQFVPVVGQTIGGAIIGTLGWTSITSAVIADAVVTALTLAATSAAVSSLGGLLGLGPSSPKADTTVTPLKTSRPPRVSAYGIARLYWSWALYETASNGTAVDVGPIHDGEMDSLVGFYLNDETVTLTGNTVDTGADGRYRDGAVSLYWTDGSTPGTAFAAVIALLPGIWTSGHRGDGVVMLSQTAKAVKSKKFVETYPNQVPIPSMVAQWQRCPDPHAEDPTDEAEWTWTENPIRQLMHYKLVREGVDYATKIAPAITYWQAASDICDTARTLAAGGTEPLYRSWVTHKHIDPHASVCAAILETCDGWIAPRADGALVVYAGQYYEPTVTIGPEEIVAFEWAGVGVDDDEAVNEIIPSYISADHDYNSVETDAWRDEGDISDRGEVLPDNFEPQVPSWGQARALAKRRMVRKNALYRGSVTTNIAGRIVRGERYINLVLTDAGTTFYDGPAEIIGVVRNMSTGGMTFEWVAADPDVDDWNAAVEEGSPAAKGDRAASLPLDTPTIASAIAEFSGDDVTLTITANSPYPDRDDLDWLARWRTVGSTNWGGELQFADLPSGPTVELVTDLVPLDGEVEVQVQYRIGDGRYSDWSASMEVTTGTVTFDSDDLTFDTINITFDRG